MVDTFKYQHSHLLQFIYEANKDGLIDQFEKIKIKEMVINQNPELSNLYMEYEKTKDSHKFAQNLKALCNGTLNQEIDPNELKNILSSPEDSRLVKRKKAKAQKIPVKSPEMFGDTVQHCQEGLSPKITFTKRKYGDDDDYEEEESD